jgi:hypothetical protein
MRKIWIALACAIVAALSVAAVASAVNTYEVDIANATKGKGSKNKPKPAQLAFGYEVDDSEDLRPEVIRQYRIAAEGLKSFPGARPDCTFEQATDPTVTDPSQLSRACRRAFVGGGTIVNEIGAPNDRSQKAPCEVTLTLINISSGDPRYPETERAVRRNGGIAIRIDTDPPRCLAPVHEALAAPFYNVRIQGVTTSELRFTVPDTLAHPAGLDNSVVDVTSKIQKKKGKVRIKGKRRTVGFYSLVGRKGKTRTVRVTFVDESGAKFTATRTAKSTLR